MVLFQEPKIIKKDEPEKTFCETILKVINEICEQKKINSYFKHYFIIKNFGLDIALFIKNSDNSYKIKFFEIKAFVGSRQGGVGFGNRYGRGPQVDILHHDDSSIDIANNFIRWVFVDGTKPEGTERYIICNNSQAKNAAMGGVRNNKQNNFRMNELLKNAISASVQNSSQIDLGGRAIVISPFQEFNLKKGGFYLRWLKEIIRDYWENC